MSTTKVGRCGCAGGCGRDEDEIVDSVSMLCGMTLWGLAAWIGFLGFVGVVFYACS